MPGKRFYRFSYYGPPRDKDRELHIHQLRDGDAALELAAVLYQRGYQYGGLLLNYPPPQDSTPKRQPPERAVDHSFLEPGDLLLLAGRPPLDDQWAGTRWKIARSHTDLEKKVFLALREYFQNCHRSEITLAERLVERLPQEAVVKRDIKFYLHHHPTYEEVDGHKYVPASRTELVTAAYLVCKREAWPGGPDLLCAFGMGGKETLLWSYFLRTRFAAWLGSREFVMAELKLKELDPHASDLRFAGEWEVTPLAEVLDPGGGL